jgi:hypothetical protein
MDPYLDERAADMNKKLGGSNLQLAESADSTFQIAFRPTLR